MSKNGESLPVAESTLSDLKPVSVTECGLQLSRISLQLLICVPGKEQQTIPPAEIECSGQLLTETRTPNGFVAEVAWSLRFPGKEDSPITISGKHHLAFTISKQIILSHAQYYSEINAVVLAYPYMRQLIEDLTTKSLGRNVMVPPLDVPRWARDQARKSQAALQGTPGAESDADAGR